jgi:hypothetical protein
MNGTIQDAIELAQQRWAAIHSFDLEPGQWEAIFAAYKTGTVLEAIKSTRNTKDPRPEKRYLRFVNFLDTLTARDAAREPNRQIY